MNSVSISQLKTKPAEIINQAMDYPVAVASRNKIKAYMVGKDLYEKMVSYMEDLVDSQLVRDVDVDRGRDFEEVAKELGI